MQNHYNLIYREEEREMFPTLKVRTTPLLLFFKFFLIKVIKINNILSTWASVRFPGPLLLADFLRVLMEIILRRSAHRVMGTNINFIFSSKSFIYLFRSIKGYSKNAGTEEIIKTYVSFYSYS
jgi:hypothetical protein